MKKIIRRQSEPSSASTRSQPMFRPVGSGWAERVEPFFQQGKSLPLQTSPISEVVIQRQSEGEGSKTEEEKNPLTEGLKTLGEQLKENPPTGESLPATGAAEFAGAAAQGAAGLAQGRSLGESFSDVNIPLGVIPNSPVEGFKYTLPEPGKSAYGFAADFTLSPYLKMLREYYPQFPLSGATLGLESAYAHGQGLSLTGGKAGLEFFGGGLKAEGKTFTELSQYPMMVPGAMPGTLPSTLMQSVPGMPPTQTDPGWQVMVTADLLKLFPDLAKRF